MSITQTAPQAPSFSNQDKSPKSATKNTPSIVALKQLGDFATQVQQKCL